MVVCGQQYGLKALRQAHLHRFWSIGTKRYSTKQVSRIRANHESSFIRSHFSADRVYKNYNIM